MGIGLFAVPVPLLLRECVDPGRDGAADGRLDCSWTACVSNCDSFSARVRGICDFSPAGRGALPSAFVGEESRSPGPAGSVVKYASEVGFVRASPLVRGFLDRGFGAAPLVRLPRDCPKRF